MNATIPRAEIQAIAERHNDHSLTPSFDPRVIQVRQWATLLLQDASRLSQGDPVRQRCTAEADDLDALADRYEKELA